jgi:hypothetical protein
MMGNTNPAAKIDFADALEAAGLDDAPEEATGLLKLIKEINKILPFLALVGIDPKKILKGIIEKWQRQRENEIPTPTPSTQHGGDPGPVPAPSPLPVPSPSPLPVPSARVITSFGLAPFWYQPRNGANLVRRETKEFDAIIHNGDGSGDPMVEHSSLAFDCTIRDQFGNPWQIEHGSQEAIDLLWWPADAPDGLANTQRMRWFFEGGDGIAEIHDNADGFNPRIKIPDGALEEKGRNYQTGALFGRYTGLDGRVRETPRWPSLRAKR